MAIVRNDPCDLDDNIIEDEQEHAPSPHEPSVDDMLDVLVTEYSPEAHHWLETEYSDICCTGDLIINDLLDTLHARTINPDEIDEQFANTDTGAISHFIGRVYDSFTQGFLMNEDPDSHWVD